ncbi:MAG: acyl-CoA dehydrogenase family protein [Thermoplasmata archaeon]
MTGVEPTSVEHWRARARRFTEKEIAPHAAALDREDRMPASIRVGLGREGFMGLSIPPEFGGQGGDTRATAAVLEEIACGSAAVATLLSVHLSVAAAPIVRWGTADQQRRYLPSMASGEFLGAFALTEPGAGSDAAQLATRYRRERKGFRIDGTKMFITNAGSADVIVLFARKDLSTESRAISAFLLPRGTAGFTVGQRLDKLGLRGSETVEVVLQDVRLGPESLLGEEGQGLSLALGALTGGRVGISACALGVARAALEELKKAVTSRPDDWKRRSLARAYAQWTAASALVERAALLRDSGEPFTTYASAAKLAASQAAVDIAQRALDVIGPAGVRGDHPAQRIFRDARVFPIVEGTTEIQELILGRTLADDERSPETAA